MKFASALRLLLTLRCEQSTQIVSDSLDRDLSGVERWAVRLHYLSCWSCRRFGKQIHQLRMAARSHAGQGPQTLSPEAAQRIRDALEQS